MKKLTVLLVALLMALSIVLFAACSGSSGTDNRDTLIVGMECEYAPYNYSQPDASNGALPIDGINLYANGYDVKIAKYIAAALDRRLVIVKMEWDSLIPAINAGTIDLIIAGMSPTAERWEAIDFTTNYYESELVVVVRKDGNFANATQLGDLDGAKIVAQRNTFHEKALVQIGGIPTQTIAGVALPANDYRYDTFTTMITALAAKSIDGYVTEESGAMANVAANSDFAYIPLRNNDTGFVIENSDDVSLAIGVKKGSELRDLVSSVLSGLTPDMRRDLMENSVLQSGDVAN